MQQSVLARRGLSVQQSVLAKRGHDEWPEGEPSQAEQRASVEIQWLQKPWQDWAFYGWGRMGWIWYWVWGWSWVWERVWEWFWRCA